MLEYKYFPKSRMYDRLAVVEFYYFKTIQMKQERKYRFVSSSRKWERYFKEYRFVGGL
jgi:hypothetical protein